jgi:DNA-binding NtrC family response regulator
MTRSTDSTTRPRILVALPPGPVRDRLLKLLETRNVTVEGDGQAAPLGTLDGSGSDVVVVRREDLSGEDRRRLDALADSKSAPDVVVVGPDLDDASKVDLVAAGATEVIDAAQLDVRAADAIETLAAGDGGHNAPDTGRSTPSLSDFASRSKGMVALLDLVRRICRTDAALLITGETGVGKEHLARAVHADSRRNGPFVAVNCGALPEDLLESELFGHEAGAFTGARTARRGCFQTAHGGSLLLDEIGEMPRHLQVKLLRALQRGEVRPVGADTDVQVDVRIMASTNRDLASDVEAGRFREDLYYRLNVVELEVPPLRDRPEDMPTLIGSLLRHFQHGVDRADVMGIDDAAIDALVRFEWPGNVRELINVLERAVLVSRGPTIGLRDLPRHVVSPSARHGASADGQGDLPESILDKPWKEARAAVLSMAERRYLEAALEACHGVIAATAERTALSPRSLYEKMRHHGLRKEDFK